MTDVRKIGYPVQVRVVDGIPQCWVIGHDHACIPDDEGWVCPEGKAITDYLAKHFGEAFDKILEADA